MESAVSHESDSIGARPRAGRTIRDRTIRDRTVRDCTGASKEPAERIGRLGRLVDQLRGFVASRSGAAATEFALVLPILILCLFAITAFASALFMQNNMINAAREAVRDIAVQDVPFTSGSVQCDSVVPGTAEEAACDYLTFWGTDFIINASNDCPTTSPKATVQISLDASQAALIDIFGFFDGKTLNAEVSMRQWTNCP